MAIVLCHPELAVRERWATALVEITTELYYATSTYELVSAVRSTKSTLALVHTSCIRADGAAELIRLYPFCRVIALADKPDDQEGLYYLKAGAVGYTNTYTSPDRLRQAVTVAEAGSVWVGQSLLSKLITGMTGTIEKDASVLAGLTDREAELANLIAEGKSNKQIASQLDITERTVKAHLNAIYRKTNTKGRLPLALLVNSA
ncbi:MAG TPA: hypothetical protein DDW55_01655 [Gammaproteobacteria bacterium]|nr:hypothetical protein [Gammaproteobacteria bacterium]